MVDIKIQQNGHIVQHVQPEKHNAAGPGTGIGTENGEMPELSYADQRRQERAERRRDYSAEAQRTEAQCEIMRRQKATFEPNNNVQVREQDGTTRRLGNDERLEMVNEANNYLEANCN